jgi:hypothetical protein
MYATPLSYVASILAGENSVKELHMLAEHRRGRLAAQAIDLPPPRHDADRAAAAWACEMVSLETAATAMPDRSIAWADFDAMLGAMPAELDRIARFFGFAADPPQIDALAAGPLMRRYSKDPNHDYSPALRQDLIAQELRLQGRDIEPALAMLGMAAERSALLRRALSRAEGK